MESNSANDKQLHTHFQVVRYDALCEFLFRADTLSGRYATSSPLRKNAWDKNIHFKPKNKLVRVIFLLKGPIHSELNCAV
jgi:hypothetical protein